MSRHVAITRLRPERRAEYLALHRDVPAAVLAQLRAHGLRQYTIHEHEGLLIGIYEHDGSDHDGDLARMVATPVMQAWWARCVPCLDVADPAAPWTAVRSCFAMQ